MEEKVVRIGKAAKILGVTAQTLRNWEKSGRLRPQRTAGGQRYYAVADLKRLLIDLPKLGWAWAASAQAPELPDEYSCERQDRFMSRLEKMGLFFQKALGGASTELASLLTLIAGEVGDNSFAHNIGNWPDVPGIFFGYDLQKRIIVLADRGQGIRMTLQRVRPEISSDTEALWVAFTEVVSGRDPEKRGNGLKVIRQIAETWPIGIELRSGLGYALIPKTSGRMRVAMTEQNVRGVYAVITF